MIEVNYLAVLACGIAAMVLGGVWYGPLFGKAWAKEMGWGNLTPEQEAAMKKSAATAYPQQFVGALLTAFVLAHTTAAFITAMNEEPSVSLGLKGAFWNWLGFMVPVIYGDKLWGGKSLKLFFINAFYQLVNLSVMAIILVSWR
ncbi:MAG: DUF1761 domain-containing protein [Ignavibacteriae bacterium]|nr:DUF1761 domain-containing protein [Ignavibacteriota bacterium]